MVTGIEKVLGSQGHMILERPLVFKNGQGIKGLLWVELKY